MPKTVPQSKVEEWKALDRINQVVHAMKCIFRETSRDDFGIDGEIEVVTPAPDAKGLIATGKFIKVQAKSGMSYVKKETSTSFATPVTKSDLELWYRSNLPVLLMVYHPEDDKLYWKEIGSYVRATHNVWLAPHYVSFDKSADVLSVSSYDSLCAIGATAPPRVSQGQQERFLSNLLAVALAPRIITFAPTTFTSYDSIRGEIQKANDEKVIGGDKLQRPPFCVIGNTLYTLVDLRNPSCTLREFCDPRHVTDLQATVWAGDPIRRRDYVFLMSQLLEAHLYGCGVLYNRDFKRYYFPRQDDVNDLFKKSWRNVRTGSRARRIVAKRFTYGTDTFWRHTAARLTFKVVGQSWFLQVEPKYFFTYDGSIPYDRRKIGPYTTRLKAVERNPHVLNHVLFWSDIMARGGSETEIKLDTRKIMVVQKQPLVGIANFAIPDDPALYEEPPVGSPWQQDFNSLLWSPEETDDEIEEEDVDELIEEDDDYE
jgi:hypothetical protein